MRISLRSFDRTAVATTVTNERKGFSVVEVIVAMVLLAIAVSSLAALTYSVSQSAMTATANAYRNGVLMQEVNRLEGLPYDSLKAVTTSVDVLTGPYFYNKKITVVEPTLNQLKTVQIIIKPQNTKFKPDTAAFIRTKARTSRALCTDCPAG
ncbi:MAG: type IV pilus modification PilV family protein [Gemmatimonadaceae bacterium]